MKQVKQWRYYCDHCKKSGGSAGHMKRHESHCTMNPKRLCGVCKLLNDGQPPLDLLLAAIPAYGEIPLEVEPLKQLRTMTNCPACIMAALRQKGWNWSPLEFDFKAEMKNIFSDINTRRRYENERRCRANGTDNPACPEHG